MTRLCLSTPLTDVLLTGKYRTVMNHWYCKYWWAGHLAGQGYTAMFLDDDAIILENPFPHMTPSQYDLEGLSDWVAPDTRPAPWVCFLSCNLPWLNLIICLTEADLQ